MVLVAGGKDGRAGSEGRRVLGRRVLLEGRRLSSLHLNFLS